MDLRTIRDGGLPDIASKVTSRRPRSAWWDRAVLALLVAGLVVGGRHLQARWLPEAPVAAAPAAPVEQLPALTARAKDLAGSPPMATDSVDAAALVDAITGRSAETWSKLRSQARDSASISQVDRGILAAVPWPLVLDRLSMQASLPRFELARQRLDGASPSEALGRRFLFTAAQQFLDGVPAPPGTWSARIEVAEAWIAVRPGTRWSLDGRTVQVPDAATAQVYQAIGHFILADLARQIEDAVDAGDAHVFETVLASLQLATHGIHLDLQRSSSTKAIIAWGTGDFEYVLGRVWLKALQKVRDEQAAVEAAKKAGYRLGNGWSAADGAVRTASLLREGREIGWVALFDPRKVRIDWTVVGSRGASASGYLLQTSGAYVTADDQTAGFSVQGGEVENFLLDTNLGGMVLVDATGMVQIADLDAGVQVPGEASPLHPLDDLGDLYLVLESLRNDRGSGFQTHVLASGGALTIRADRASPELRERRMLVTAKYKKNPIVGIVDIPGEHRMSLYEAAVVAMAALETSESAGGPGLDVVGIANLDVGAFDVLDARTDTGKLVRSGPKPLSGAMNLLRFRAR